MVTGRTACLWFLRWEKLTELLPVLIGESRQSRHQQRSGYLPCSKGSLPPSPQDMKALGLGLVVTSEMRPVQAVVSLLRCLSHGLQQTAHLRQRQCESTIDIDTFFSCSRACPCITTSAACASKERVM